MTAREWLKLQLRYEYDRRFHSWYRPREITVSPEMYTKLVEHMRQSDRDLFGRDVFQEGATIYFRGSPVVTAETSKRVDDATSPSAIDE